MIEEKTKDTKDLDYDLELFDEANDRATKLFEARLKQAELLEKGAEDGEIDVD